MLSALYAGLPRDVRSWSSAQVQVFLERTQIVRDATLFRTERIDGVALLLLDIDAMRTRLKLSLAKALKVKNLVLTVLRQRVVA